MLFALAASVVVSFADVIAKWLVAEYPVAMVSWSRMGFITLILGAVGAAQLGPRLIRPNALRLQVLRGLSSVIGTSAAFLGFRLMPLAECLAIIMVAPVLANLLSHWWLDEPGDSRSWFAAAASFVGVLVIVRPGLGVFSWEVALPVVCALSLAFFQASTRALSGHDDPRVTAFFGPAVAFCVFSLAMPFNWVTPRSWFDAGLFVALGAIVEKVSGMPYETFVADNVFGRAEMTSTGYLRSDRPADDIALGYTRREGDGTLRSSLAMHGVTGSAAGGGYSTALDLLTYAKAVSAGRFPGAEAGLGIAGGAPGTNAVLEVRGEWVVVVLSNFDPPTAERIGLALANALSR